MKRISAFLTFLFLAITSASAASLLPPGMNCFYDANGASIPLGSVTFYIPSTTTPKDTWTDSNQGSTNDNPLTLDSSGCAIIYGSGVYREIVKDADGNLIWDQLTADPAYAAPQWGGTAGGTDNAQTVTVNNFSSQDGQTIYYIASHTNTGATTISVSGGSTIAIVKDLVSGPTALTGSEIVTDNIIGIIYETSTGQFHLLSPATGQSGTDYQAFTSSGTWTKPTFASSYSGSMTFVQCWGAGGGGGTGTNAGGGGGGAYVAAWFLTSGLASSVSVSIPTGGATNTAGGNATFGSHLTAYGGGAGNSTTDGGGGGGGGGLAAGANASTTTGGLGGSPSISASNGIGAGGAGGTSGSVGNPNGFGGGGGGGGGTTTTGANGGASGWGGGGGGGGANTTAGSGGSSLYGGGGGAGKGGSADGSAGSSKFGGAGGASGSAGSAPGGGGGRNAAGGRGECRVSTTP